MGGYTENGILSYLNMALQIGPKHVAEIII